MHVVLFLTVLAAVYAGAIVLFYAFQERFFFHPKTLPRHFKYPFQADFEELFLPLPDGAVLNALFFRTPQPSKGVVLYFHGNADNLLRWGRRHADFVSRGYDFFVYDYRTFGKSTGIRNEAGFHNDAQFVYEYLLEKYPAEKIVLYGRSLGTGIASRLASKVPFKMLILETPYDSFAAAIRVRFPYLWLPFPFRYDFRNDSYLPEIKCPVFIFHGTDDELIRLRSAKKLEPLVDSTGNFYVIVGGKHKNLPTFEAYQREIARILGD